MQSVVPIGTWRSGVTPWSSCQMVAHFAVTMAVGRLAS